MLPSNQLGVRLRAANAALERARAQRDMTANRLSILETEVGDAKFRLSLKDEVEAIILDIQDRNHQRTVGMYEALLSQILQEVLRSKEKTISLGLGTKAGKPSLDIAIANNGMPEDIMSGSGGSVANIVSAGLRFIALSRVDCRRFIVLDEADCWLEPDRIAYFANVVSQMGAEMGVQSLMISHHNSGSFWDAATTVVRFYKDDSGRLMAEHQKESQTHVGPTDIALIELKDFMSHEHTVLKMGPGMTVINGANDIGKSAVVSALHAIAEADFRKEYVRHGCDAGFVRLVLGNSQTIEMQRNVKGSPAMIYRLIEVDGTVAHESPVKNDIPQWAAALIGIRMEQDLDIQLGNQKSPVFLLDEAPSKRASILSVGGEASRLVDMQEKYKDWLKADKSKVVGGEAVVAQLRRDLEAFDALLSVAPAAEAAARSIEEANRLSVQQERLTPLMQKISLSERRAVAGEGLAKVSIPDEIKLVDESRVDKLLTGLRKVCRVAELDVPSVSFGEVKVVDVVRLDKLLSVMKRALPVARLNVPALSFSDVKIVDTSKLNLLTAGLSRAEHRATAASKLPQLDKLLLVKDPQLVGSDALQSLIGRMNVRASEGKKVAQQESVAAQELVKVAAEYDALVTELGGVCPICHGHLNGVHGHT